ncbi:MAG TPA: fructosamine kinase family protein [Myxococcales bacterium LLY-WYZ-16_1]|nr:fructosamine kinase family protein [Myxococcales bacterium LLY-WYZ-16_1]
MRDWQGHLREALQSPVQVLRVQALSGGDIAEAVKIETSRGSFFGKSHPSLDFGVEAETLRMLKASGTSLCIPEVLGAGHGWLLLEFVPRGRPGPGYDEALGRGLAELHARKSDRFGFPFDTTCGATQQPNPREEEWATFYREHRIRHQLDLLFDRGRIGSREARPIEVVLDRIEDWVGPACEPALIHGDLWSGNVYANQQGQPTLIDPAAYYAHPEAELGMMTLFGGFPERTYRAYESHSDVAADWRDRNELYRLYHLMNHANLFGGSYVSAAVDCAKRCISSFG